VKKKPLAYGLVFIGVVALLVGWLSSRNSLFMLSEIVVKASHPQIEKTLQSDLVALLGRRLTSLSLEQVEGILRKNPRVKRAVFHKRWPSTLEVAIEERSPVAVAFLDRRLVWIDENGTVISVVDENTPYILLRSFEKTRHLDELKRICAWLASSPKNDWIDEIEWFSQKGLVARNLSLHQEVELGFADFDAAWKRAEIALKFLQEKKIPVSLLDATYQHRVIARLQGDLRNFENGLNLKELVRRTGKIPAAAR
jgi:cell division septal protein FtsQ